MSVPAAVCLIGAECTGKTSLAAALAERFGGLWVGEHLRDFCAQHERTPTRDEQANILERQFQLEEGALMRARRSGKQWVFCDTAPLLTAIYSDFIFGDRSLYPRARVLHERYALTLNLEPDVPWVADGIQRDGAHVRAPVQAMIERELSTLAVPWQQIAGHGAIRLGTAVAAVESLAR